MNINFLTRTLNTIAILLSMCGHGATAEKTIKQSKPFFEDEFPRRNLDEVIFGEINVPVATVPGIWREIVHRSSLPIGWEEKRYERGNLPRKFHFHARDITLRHAMDLLIAKDSDYSWEVSNGVVNLSPQDSMLNSRVPSFVVRDRDFYAATRVLFELLAPNRKEFQRTLEDIVDRQTGLFAWYGETGPRISINMRDSTLRECLNELIRQDRGHDWVFHYLSRNESPPRFQIVFIPKRSALKPSALKAEKKRHEEFEEKALREGFRKGRDGTWSKPGPGGKWVTPEAQIEKPDGNQPKRKENK